MAKAKKKAGTKAAGTKRGPRITSVAKKPEDMQGARERLGLCEELRKDEAEPEGDVESKESEPEE